MAKENEEMVVESKAKTPAANVEKEVTVAPGEEKTTVTAEAEVTPGTPETPAATDAPDENDISDLLALLNEVQSTYAEGGDEITEIPDNLRPSLKVIAGKLVALREAFKDPLFKAVLDDMVDQQEDGSTPSLLVAVARNAPMEELQELGENENYADVQAGVDDRIAKETADAEAEETMMANFEESQKAGQEYADEMGYSEEESQRLFASAMAWFKVLGDGKITKDEWAKVDKADNYDRDTEELRKQLPVEPKKEMMPDQASMEAAVTEKPKTPRPAMPKNAVETVGAAPVADWQNLGTRKFMKKG